MAPSTVRRIHTVYGIVLSLLIVAVAVCFVLSCIDISESGASPFSRESVAAHFDRIAIPVYITLVAILGGGILTLVLPLERRRLQAIRDPADQLATMIARYDTDVHGTLGDCLHREARLRRILTAIATGISVAAVPLPLWWCLDKTHFAGPDRNADIRTAAIVVLGFTFVAMAFCVAAGYLCAASRKRSVAAIQAAMADGTLGRRASREDGAAPTGHSASTGHLIRWGVRGLILVVAVVFIVLGVQNGGMADVLGKAVRICTECIGLG